MNFPSTLLDYNNNYFKNRIILDEYISILKHFDSPTMKKEKITDLQNFIIFKEKLLSTKKILCF